MNDRGDTVRVVRVDRATVIIFSVVLSPCLLAGAVFLRGGDVRGGAFGCAFYLLVLVWICSPSVEIAPGRLVYRVLFYPRKEIDLSGVTKASLIARPAPGLELRRSRKVIAVFGIKPFSVKDIAAILEHVRASSPGVEFNPAAEAMLKGDPRLLTRATLNPANLKLAAVAIFITAILVALARLLLH